MSEGQKVEIIVPIGEQPRLLNEALHILAKLRMYEKIWERHYGAANKKKLKVWQDKADALLAKLNIVFVVEKDSND